MKNLFIVLLFIPAFSYAASIDKYIEKTPNWSNEATGVIYITTRCSAILMVTGQHRIEVGDQEFGPVILELGETLAKRSTKLALKSELNLGVIQDRLVFWVKKYAEDSISNTDYYDNIFVGDYALDFNFCYDLVRTLNSQRQ